MRQDEQAQSRALTNVELNVGHVDALLALEVATHDNFTLERRLWTPYGDNSASLLVEA